MKRVHVPTRDVWRQWLHDNHLKETSVELLSYKKHTGKPSISHRESMEEAICYGWIDTTIKRLDDKRYVRRFVRRNDNSRWSSATLGYAKRLLAEGKMSPHGVKLYEEGKRKPTIDAGIPRDPPMPDDLKKNLQKEDVLKQFEAFPPSSRRMYLRWLFKAARTETRQKRIDAIVERARTNQKNWSP